MNNYCDEEWFYRRDVFNSEKNKFDLMKYRMESAKSDLKSAKILMEAEEYRAANNRAYYSIFHAISAIQILKAA